MKINFNKIIGLRGEYRKQLYWYNHSLEFILKFKQSFTINILYNNPEGIENAKDGLNRYRDYLKETTDKLIELKKAIKKEEKDFNECCKYFYIDYQNTFGKNYNENNKDIRLKTGSNKLKVNMNYFYNKLNK